jgi:cGMP-dependent protein kinase
MKRGDFFGELALLYSSPRSASVRVKSKCSFWCLSQYLFQKIQRDMVKHNYKVAKPFVNKLPLFSFLNPKQKDSISYSMNTLKYAQG